jgi:hypothetical protein
MSKGISCGRNTFSSVWNNALVRNVAELRQDALVEFYRRHLAVYAKLRQAARRSPG